MATIVTKLFHIVQPTVAYFGQKDAAQCVLVQRLVRDLDLGVVIVVRETVRACDGLALSSRNAYLTAAERAAAPVVYRALCAAQSLFDAAAADAAAAAAGDASTASSSSALAVVSSAQIKDAVVATLRSEPLVSEIQYVAVDSRETMRPLSHVLVSEGAIVSLACKIGRVRLIDNVVLPASPAPVSQSR